MMCKYFNVFMIKYFPFFIYLYISMFKYKHIYRRFGERCIITFRMIWGQYVFRFIADS